MSGEIAVRKQQTLAPVGGVDPVKWQMFMDIANEIHDTDFVPAGLRRNGPAIVACMLYGDALGLHPMISLKEVSIIDGKPSLSANVVVARIRQFGHRIWRSEVTDDKGNFFGVTAHGKRSDGEEDSFTFTMGDAARAGLANKNNWRNYPQAMCWARAATQLARMLFADIFLGSVYTAEELGADVEVDAAGEISERAAGSGDPAGEPSAVLPIVTDERMPPGVAVVVGDGMAQAVVIHATGAADVLESAQAGGATAGAPPVVDPPAGESDAATNATPSVQDEAATSTAPAGPPAHAEPFILTRSQRAELIGRVGQDVAGTAIVQWDKIGNAGTLSNRVRDTANVDLLRLLADHEAQNKARKTLLGVCEGRLSILADEAARKFASTGGGAAPSAETAPSETNGTGDPPSPAASISLDPDDKPTEADLAGFTEALGFAAAVGDTQFAPPVTATPLQRLKAFVAFVRDQPGAVEHPEAWTVPALFQGAKQSGWNAQLTGETIDCFPDDLVLAVWGVIPADVRGHIELLPSSDVAALAGTLS